MRMRTLLVALFCALQVFLILQGVPTGVIVLIGLAAAVVCLWDARRLKEVARDRLKHPLDAAPEDRGPRSDV